MSDPQGVPQQGQDKSLEAGGHVPEQPPPPYAQGPSNPGYPVQPPPAAGYPVQPPPAAGYPVQPPPAGGYAVQQPPQPGNVAYPGQQPVEPGNVVIVNQPGMVVHHTITYRDTPVAIECPNCHNQITSNVRREIGMLTLLVMGALCIFGLWLFCCLIPLCVNACKDAVHTCPVCKHQLGRWSQLN